MEKRMKIELNFSGGGTICKEILYIGTSEEIARQIENDENELLEYMLTGNIKGAQSFCFGGFMFKKKGLVAAQMKEPDF